MKDRYAGDEGDYAKYALLRALCAPSDGPRLRLGVNWHLTEHDEGNTDGERRRHLEGPEGEWSALDPQLLRLMRRVFAGLEPSQRGIRLVEGRAVLPAGTRFFSDPMPERATRRADRVAARGRWAARASAALEWPRLPRSRQRFRCFVVWCRKPSPGEVRDLRRGRGMVEGGRSVVVYQHQPRMTWDRVRSRVLADLAEAGARGGAVELITFNDRGFFVLPAPGRESRLRAGLEGLTERTKGCRTCSGAVARDGHHRPRAFSYVGERRSGGRRNDARR